MLDTDSPTRCAPNEMLHQDGIGNAKTVGNYLMALEEKGILESVKVGKEKPYLNKKLSKILEDK